MQLGILGAGLAGISLAEALQDDPELAGIELLEKAPSAGGLARSYAFGKLHYDCGPHIIFSKNAEVLDLMVDLLGANVRRLRRSNKIFHDGRLVKYPFENQLSALCPADRDYCLSSFLENPYAGYTPQNMLQFFLATFGEGITNLYLRPYNEKIWKFDPAFIDTQMVERIPKPPAEDIIDGAKGNETEGHRHQLHFHYPKQGGIQSLLQAFIDKLDEKVAIRLNAEVTQVEKSAGQWIVSTADGLQRRFDRLVSTIPLPQLVAALGASAPRQVADAAARLKFNSIALVALRVNNDNLGDDFVITIAERSILFHRLTKLNFLSPPETGDGSTSLLLEMTYRPGDPIDRLGDDELTDRAVADLRRTGLIGADEEILAAELRREEFAYVICDLEHRRNVETIRDWCEGELGIMLHGRFGEFTYINMDTVLQRSLERCSQMKVLA